MRDLIATSLVVLPVLACTSHPGGADIAQTNPTGSPLDGAALVLDVRTPEEYAGGHLDGATLIPVAELEARLDEVERALDHDKGRKIVAYCRSGRRSGMAKQLLEQHGYSNVVNGGGYEALASTPSLPAK